MFYKISLLIVIIIDNCQTSSVFVYKSLLNCKKHEYYDLDTFNCITCNSSLNLIPSNDHTSCTCNLKTSINQVHYNAKTQQPICIEKCKNCTTAVSEINATEKCNLKRITNTWNETIHKDAQIVPWKETENCTCDRKLNLLYENLCIPNVLLKDFEGYASFSERNVYKDLSLIGFQCKALRDKISCQHLANLCVMSFYSLDKNSPCSHFYIRQASDIAGLEDDGGVDGVRPYLFFMRGKAGAQDLEKSIDYSYTLDTGKRSILHLVTTAHTMEGRLQRISQLLPPYFDLCNKNTLSTYDAFVFGRSFQMSCKLSLEAIIDLVDSPGSQLFYSVFLNYTIDGVVYLKPVPILIRDAFKGNENNNRDDWQFVKRFTPFYSEARQSNDDISSLLNGEDVVKLRTFKTIKFVDNFKIYCTIRDGNKIATPIIVLHYKHIEVLPNNSLMQGHHFEFGVEFTKKHNLDFWFEIVLPLLVAIAFAFALLRTFNFKKRQNKEYYDFAALFQFSLFLFSNCASAFFAVASAVCLYVLAVYTTQSTVHILVPVGEQSLVDILMILACILKGVYLVFHFWKIAHVDIFFIDWERPKGQDAHLTARSHSDTPSVCSSARTLVTDAVSAWRNYFVANEWIKISTNRKTSIFLQCILVLITMKILEKEWPNLYRDKTLFVGLSLVIYISVYVMQLATVFVVCDRIRGNPLQQFVDICSTANVSVFILLQESFGFYIHGRSPHGFSDTDMSSMIIQMQRESQNMCGKRGLLTGSDQQTYIILAPMNLRTYYKKLLTPLQRAATTRSQIHIEDDFLNHKNYESSLEKTALAYSSVNRFFCAFIDHAIKDLDYIIKDRTFIEVLLSCEFENYLSDSKGTFYIDNGHSFDRVLLYGNDFQHFIFEMMLFTSILIATDSLIVSTFVISISYKIFQLVFRAVVKSNLSAKTLIDKRFLI